MGLIPPSDIFILPSLCPMDVFVESIHEAKYRGSDKQLDRIGPVRSSRMPSYTEEQKRRAVETVEECGGSVTRAMRKLGYPTRQTLYR